jgi:hypothetical protein
MEQPQEVVEDKDHERAWDRVAAIDVAKASGWSAPGSRTTAFAAANCGQRILLVPARNSA